MGAIDLATAKAMVQNYTSTRRKLIDETYGIRDTRAIWFSIDQVKEFMSAITPDITGVRIYLGAYDDTDDTYPNQTTIIAIGTIDDGTGKNVDPVGQTSPLLKGDGGPDPYNHGNLCPPNVDCG